ncbi:MAG: hypothetical protein JW896_04450 [Deltaproteobacteria bacterium]|nr:hypothetical protein [Deltaproteobacteria bacterium]
MISKKEEIKTDLEEIISRLGKTMNNVLDMRESNEEIENLRSLIEKVDRTD